MHAASYIRERSIVLESCLLKNRSLFRFILVHELFHFVWVRLNNAKRAEFGQILSRERKSKAKGELGESSEARKAQRPEPGSALWKDYACESFCDTAAFFYSGVNRCSTTALSDPWLSRRKRWFDLTFAAGCRC